MWITITLIVFYLVTPSLLIYLCRISGFLNKLGTVVLAYILGLIAGNISIFPPQGSRFRELLTGRSYIPEEELLQYFRSGQITESDLIANQISNVQDTIITIVIPLAIPLLLFSLDLRKWLKLLKGTALSLVLAMISLIISIFSGYYLIGNSITDSWKVSGMLIGVYTGGTPNLAAIGTALQVNPDIFILTHTYDLIIGAVALLFLMTIAQRLFNTFLPRFDVAHKPHEIKAMGAEYNHLEDYKTLLLKDERLNLLKALPFQLSATSIPGLFSHPVISSLLKEWTAGTSKPSSV